jgi:hypothetical protein
MLDNQWTMTCGYGLRRLAGHFPLVYGSEAHGHQRWTYNGPSDAKDHERVTAGQCKLARGAPASVFPGHNGNAASRGGMLTL